MVSGTRTIVLDNVTSIVCFATKGFKVDNIHYSNTGVIARFYIDLIVKSVAYGLSTTADSTDITADSTDITADSTIITADSVPL